MGNTKGVRRDFEALEKRRFKAIRLVEQGCSQSETARRLKVARQSVSEWLRRYRRDGEAGLRQAGRAGLVMPTLVPNEQVTISYLYFPPTTWKQINGPVKSDEGLARVLQVLPTEQYPMWFNRLAAGLILIGLIALVYVLFVIMGRLLV
jgi:transcriptional regulator with XRE-family HTH domain